MDEPRTTPRRQVVLLTGASTGLGLNISKILIAQNSYHLILTARANSLDRFKREGILESDQTWIRQLDVTDEGDREILMDEVDQKLDGIDILINNAGVNYRSVVEHVTEEERLTQMNVNFRSPMELIRLVLPKMRENRRGRIINISSVGGMMAMPTMAIYSASKFALEGATEALWNEVRPWGIHVSLVQPGFINSVSFKNVRLTKMGQKALTDSNDPYYYHYYYMSSFIERLMKLSPASQNKVAKVVLKTLKQKSPPLRVPGTPDAYLFSMIRRLLPRSVYHWLLYLFLPGIRKWGKQIP